MNIADIVMNFMINKKGVVEENFYELNPRLRPQVKEVKEKSKAKKVSLKKNKKKGDK